MSGENSLAREIEALGFADPQARRAATIALGSLSDELVVEPLIRALGHRKWKVRKGAAELLGARDDTAAVKPLIKALKDEDGLVRYSAAHALGALGGFAAVVPLVAALDDTESYVRRSVAEALEALADAGSRVWVLKALSDKEWWKNESMMSVMTRLGIRSAIAIKIRELCKPQPAVHTAAAEALEAIGRSGCEALVANLLAQKSEGRPTWVLERITRVLEALVEDWRELVARPIEELVEQRRLNAPFADAALLYRTRVGINDLSNDSRSRRVSAAKELCLVASLCPSLIIEQWQSIRDRVRERHADGPAHKDIADTDGCVGKHTDSHPHRDRGIFLSFPEKPPVDTERDF